MIWSSYLWVYIQKTWNQYLHSHDFASLFTIPRYGNSLSVPWWKDECDIDLSISVFMMEHYSTLERNKILPFATTWMNLEDITLSVMSEAKRQILCYFICMWNLRQSISQTHLIHHYFTHQFYHLLMNFAWKNIYDDYFQLTIFYTYYLDFYYIMRKNFSFIYIFI